MLQLPSLPKNGFEGVTFVHDGQAHVCGGTIESGLTFSPECYKFDVGTKSWLHFTSMTKPHVRLDTLDWIDWIEWIAWVDWLDTLCWIAWIFVSCELIDSNGPSVTETAALAFYTPNLPRST